MKLVKVPAYEARRGVAQWRINLFYKHWGPYPKGDHVAPFLIGAWLKAKTIALVDSDRALMPDGSGAMSRVINHDR